MSEQISSFDPFFDKIREIVSKWERGVGPIPRLAELALLSLKP